MKKTMIIFVSLFFIVGITAIFFLGRPAGQASFKDILLKMHKSYIGSSVKQLTSIEIEAEQLDKDLNFTGSTHVLITADRFKIEAEDTGKNKKCLLIIEGGIRIQNECSYEPISCIFYNNFCRTLATVYFLGTYLPNIENPVVRTAYLKGKKYLLWAYEFTTPKGRVKDERYVDVNTFEVSKIITYSWSDEIWVKGFEMDLYTAVDNEEGVKGFRKIRKIKIHPYNSTDGKYKLEEQTFLISSFKIEAD